MAYKLSKIIILCELISILVIFLFMDINKSFAKIGGSETQIELSQAKEKNPKPETEEEEEEEEDDDDC
jgi:hypothetical protein